MISKTKIDDSFPVDQFLIEGFCTPHRLDRNSKGVGEDITLNLTAVDINPIESFYAELNLRNPHKSLIGNHIDAISKTLVLHSSTCSKIILLGDFNTEIDEQQMQSFYDNYSLKSLIRQTTCCKNFEKKTCIDLILTNMPRSFQSKCVIETGLSNFHLMTLTIIRKNFRKKKKKLNQVLQTVGRIIIFQMNITKDVCLKQL